MLTLNLPYIGPGLVYLSRAPNNNVKTYDGSGDWFKIYEEGVCNPSADFKSTAWCSTGRNFLAARIPKDTPNGEYLARFEHIGKLALSHYSPSPSRPSFSLISPPTTRLDRSSSNNNPRRPPLPRESTRALYLLPANQSCQRWHRQPRSHGQVPRCLQGQRRLRQL